ncbi:MAG: MFS transporter [Clostridia bacterium]|nr:MFS transporter [Clostridia bacterium]
MFTDNQQLWTRDFNLLALSNLLMAISFYFLLPTLPVYVVKSLGADKSQIGYIIGVYTLAAVSIRPLAGYALDSLGRRPVYLYALGLFALIMPVYQLATSLALLLVIRLLHGFSWGVVTTGGGTIVADIIPPKRRGEGIGYYGMAMTIAMAIGPIIGLWLTGETNFSRLFTSAGILAASALLLASFVKYPEVPAMKRSLTWQAFFEVKVLPLSAVMFFVTVVYGGVVSFITIYGPEVGIKNAGLFFLVYAVFMGLTRPVAGRLFDKKGPTPVMSIGFTALITAYALLALWRNPVGFLTSAAVMGIGFGMVWPCLMAMTINMVQPHRRGVANSTVFSALDLGIGGGSVVLGLLANYTSISTMYLVSAFILIIPAVLYFGYVSKGYLSALISLRPEN